MRLDETNTATIVALSELNVPVHQYQADNAPIDVCFGCYAHLSNAGITDDVAHPNYDEDRYKCAICGRKLDQRRDG